MFRITFGPTLWERFPVPVESVLVRRLTLLSEVVLVALACLAPGHSVQWKLGRS